MKHCAKYLIYLFDYSSTLENKSNLALVHTWSLESKYANIQILIKIDLNMYHIEKAILLYLNLPDCYSKWSSKWIRKCPKHFLLRRHQKNDQLMFFSEFITLFSYKNGGLGFWDPCLTSSRQNAIFVTKTGSLIYAGSTRLVLIKTL